MTNQSAVWVEVCPLDDLLPGVGVRALIGDRQVAIFRIDGDVYALDAIDPFSAAAVLSRGIVGDLQGHLVVASPIYKQHFRLSDGVCLEDDAIKVPVYPVTVNDGVISVSTEACQ